MADENDQTAATSAPAVGDGEQPTRTTEADDRNAGESDAEQLKAENARLRSALEQSKAEKANLETLKREREQGAVTPATTDPRQEALRRRGEVLRNAAAQGDEYAQAILDSFEFQAQMQRDIDRKLELVTVPNDDRAKVQELVDSGRFTIDSAREHVELQKRLAAQERQMEELKTAGARRAAAQAADDEPDFGARSAGPDGKRAMTRAQVLRALDQNSGLPFNERRQLYHDLNDGKVIDRETGRPMSAG